MSKGLLPTVIILLAISVLVMSVIAYQSGAFSMTAVGQSSGVRVTFTTRSDALLQSAYLDRYGVSVDTDKEHYIESYSVNGGNWTGNTPDKAFDGSFDTFWETNTVNTADFKNHIAVEFNAPVTLDRIMFATRRDSQWQKGFPLTATFYASEDGQQYDAIAVGVAELMNNVVLYTFDEPFTTKYFKFEYTEIYSSNITQHASASELIFLQPEEAFIVQVQNMFADYAHSTLLPEYDDRAVIDGFKAQLSGHPLYDKLESHIERAYAILDGTLFMDYVNRQFTTDPDGRGVLIQQRGDIVNYGQKLRFMFGLSNYMPTGIFGNSGKQITVYVEADEGQPLPSIVFTQFLTTYQYWQGSKIPLNRGVNVLTVPSFTYTESYTNAGGAIYLVNPYTPSEQNTSVKVYIEGGHTYPVFFKGGSEEKFKNDIIDYLEYYNANTDTAFNMVEVMTDNMLVTAQASTARKIYIDNGVSVQKACENWDAYMRKLYEFSGIGFDPDMPFYDPRVEKLYLNVRVMQPFSAAADAYATGQHVGIRINTGWETVALQGSGFGWGTSHEIGHIIEIGEYRVLEYTNNMVSNYNQAIIDGLDSRGDHDKITNLLAPDSILDKDGIASGGSYDNTYVAWWNIESVFPGYWGRYNNLFRYGVPDGYPSASGMSATEKQVYYSSIAVGIDLGYYFDRYGYRFNGVQFKEESVSAAYANAVGTLIAGGKLSTKQLKLWYVGGNTSTLNYGGDGMSVYSEQIKINPLYIGKEGDGYRINLPDNSGNAAHLGYEIIENGAVIGFTRSSVYYDGTSYEDGYTPQYRVRAYDQTMGCTAASDVWQFNAEKAVARIGDVEFTSLSAALQEAQEGDTIVLLTDIGEEGLTVDKSVTLTGGGKTVNILKTGNLDIFNIASGVTLTVRGTKEAPVVVDGGGVARQGRVFSSAGHLKLDYVNFKDLNGTTADGSVINLWGANNTLTLTNCNFTDITGTGRGGAVYVVANSTISVTIDNCTFTNCVTTGSANGGAVFTGATATITNTRFTGNRSVKNSGGALYVAGAGSVISDCVFSGNYADAQDRQGGGAMYIAASCTVENCTFSGNSVFSGANGSVGGAVYVSSGTVQFVSSDFIGNKAFWGGAAYISSGTVTFTDCTMSDNAATEHGGVVFISWSQSTVKASFDKCTITDNTAGKDGIIYNNYYFYAGYEDYGLGQKLLNITNTVFKDNTSGGASIHTAYHWLQLNAEGSTIIGSVNKKIDLRSSYDGLYITLLQDNGIDGEIVKRSYSPMGDDIVEHFFLSGTLADKYRLELGATGNSLWLRELIFNISVNVNGNVSTDGVDYVYGNSFVLPAAPVAEEGFTFDGWLYGGTLYQLGEEITLDSGGDITAVFTQYLYEVNLVYGDGTLAPAGKFRKGDVIDTTSFAQPTDENFLGWSYKGVIYMSGDKVVFDGRNFDFVAVYSQSEPVLPPGGDNEGGENGGNGGEESDGENGGNGGEDSDGGNGGNGDVTIPGGGTGTTPDGTPGVTPDAPDAPHTPEPEESNYVWVIILIAVLTVGGGAGAAILLLVKKRKSDE